MFIMIVIIIIIIIIIIITVMFLGITTSLPYSSSKAL